MLPTQITETIFKLNSLDEDDKEKLILYLTRKSLPKANMSYEKELEVIRVRKLKRKLEYLRLELEEVDFIFQHCMKTFDRDFSEYVKPTHRNKHLKM